MNDIRLMCGPVDIPLFIREAMLREAFSHRTTEYETVHKNVEKHVQTILGTKEDVYIMSSSGTGGMQTAIINCFNVGDEVVVPVLGDFSNQFADMAERLGLKTIRVPFEPGQPADLEIVKAAVTEHTKGVLLTHNESATGVTNDLDAYSRHFRGTDCLLVVDSISAAGGVPIEMDARGIDVLITASQKCLMSPPGIAFVALSPRAWEAVEKVEPRDYYFDLRFARDFQQRNQTPRTPNIYTLLALEASLGFMAENDMFKHHRENADRLRNGLDRIGLDRLVKDSHFASDTLTVVLTKGKSKQYVAALKERGITVTAGLKPLQDDTFRIGTMGYVEAEKIDAVLAALAEIKAELGA